MFFVFGSPRSGTTLLAQCLDSHPEIVVPHETDFIIPLAFVCDRVPDPAAGRAIVTELITRSAGFGPSIGEYLTAERVAEIIAGAGYQAGRMIEAVYAAVAEAAGARLAGDKSPNDLLFLRMLVKVGGIAAETRIVHIVRDVRDVMVSLEETGWVPDLGGYFARFWSSSNLYLHTLYRDCPEQYLLVRYEDLVRDPAAWLARICRLLGVAYRPEMLEPSRFHPRYRGMPHHARLYSPISADRIGVFQTAEPARVAAYETQAREALEVFGYPLAASARGMLGSARAWLRRAR